MEDIRNKSLVGIAVSFIMIAILLGIENLIFYDENFFDGIQSMMWTFVFVSVAFFPAFLMRKKESAKKKYMNILGIITLVFFAFVFLFLVMLLFNSEYHFLF